MFQNIKVDIIYYRTNTDFELEFNLCGCCRMRLLTDKAPDKKTLVHSLARAVSRSRVIIIAGKLCGGEGIIDLISHAIGKGTSVIDKARFGISATDEITVISGSTPLVTSEGEFGGCIIESGPQSMILLSDDKAVRKTVMNTLIHPYIEELCATELKAKANAAAQAPTVATEPAAEQTETLPEQPETDLLPETEDILSSTSAANPAEENGSGANAEVNKEIITKSTEIEDIPINSYTAKAAEGVELSGGMIFEEDSVPESGESAPHGSHTGGSVHIKPKNVPLNLNSDYSAEPFDEIPYSGDNAGKAKRPSVFYGNIAILITAIVLLVALAILCYCIFYVPSKEGVSAAEYLRETFGTLFGNT